MLFEPKIDLSIYCDDEGKMTAEGAEQLKKDTDASFEELAELKSSVNAGVCVYKGRINEKLQERTAEAYEGIVGFLSENAYQNTAQYDDELQRFSCTAAIYRLEEGSVETTIYDCIEYIDDFAEIYSEMLFLFRRILMDMPHEEGLAFIEKKKLSVFALEQMLREMPIGGKDIIAASLAGYYRSIACVKEAEYLRKATEV